MNAPDLEVPPALLTGLLQLVRATVRDAIKASGEGATEADPWVAIDTYLDMTRREAADLARGGKVEGARKVGNRWRARRSECDAVMVRIGLPPPVAKSTPPDDADQGADGVLAELGLKRVRGKVRGAR